MEIYNNKFHDGHTYLDIEDYEVDEIQSSDFEKIINEYHKPLQVMVSSSDRRLGCLLTQSGFQLMRRSFKVKFSASDMIVALSAKHQILTESVKGEKDYFECAEIMYCFYRKTHYDVNPLTASLEEFMDVLPATVLYSREGCIEAAAFVENNEIAYMCANNLEAFGNFAPSLLDYMFGINKNIIFEADDTDWVATKLREMFVHKNEESCDTYVKTS